MHTFHKLYLPAGDAIHQVMCIKVSGRENTVPTIYIFFFISFMKRQVSMTIIEMISMLPTLFSAIIPSAIFTTKKLK